ncbi:uncharacterized protein LOC124944563 isoform X2 [Impatiens glandulifera]|uniref:uncharacterized protein LOC124944563 isoform X2 n=1 Tax=Impatiens glandulifera TaxID=253017 RepID=UPI001FB13FDB|nr:uncharacterized protein LOC124944563 isoform X2 [Impatiens glandulifera]
MILNLGSPSLLSLTRPSQFSFKTKNNAFVFLIFTSKRDFSSSNYHDSANFSAPRSYGKEEISLVHQESLQDDTTVLDEDILNCVSAAKDACEALDIIAEKSNRGGGVVSNSDCCSIIMSAFDRSNVELTLSIFAAMRSSFSTGDAEMNSSLQRWRWSRPGVRFYTLLVLGLAASLRVSDAVKIIFTVSRVGVSPGEEVPFGKIVRCPTCMIAVAVAQPQHGIQAISCSKCRYQYELVSGNIISIESEEVSMDIPAWRRGLRFLQIKKQSLPAAVHSIVVQTPSGAARTHRFATETVELPAREGERVTIAVAAPSSIYREVGPLKISPKSPKLYPGEPMSLMNHNDGRESLLLRAPSKDKGSSLLNPSIIVPLLAVMATGDAATSLIDPSLPQLISVAAISSIAVGATLNSFILPQLAMLPQKAADAIAIKQQLLAQYDQLQSRIQELKTAAENEIWMLARMCQLENKIHAVGEPSYRARQSRIKRVREGLENSLEKRIELIDSYARTDFFYD